MFRALTATRALGSAAAFLVMVAGTVAPAASADRDPARAIAELLEQRAAAVRAGDRAAFLATVSPLASNSFRTRQAEWFDHLRQVPLASYSLEARWDVFGDLTRDRDERRYRRADRVALPLTQERLAIAGFDELPAAEDVYLTFALYDGKWAVASDSDVDDLGLLSARGLWAFGAVETRTGEHFMLLEHPGADAPDATLALAENALRRVDRFWGGKWRKRVPIVAPASEEELRRMLQLTVDLSDFVAFAYATVDDRRGGRFTGTRIVLNPDAMAGRSRSATFDVLVHELAHVAARRHAGPLTPLWVEEGLAEHVRSGGTGAPRGAGATGRLPRDADFQYGDVGTILQAYDEAHSAVGFFVDHYGLPEFRRFYRRLGRAGGGFGTQRYHLDRAMRATIGTSLRGFEGAWASSIGGS